MSDRRKHPRVVPLPDKPVEIQIVGTDFIEILRARDVSAGGMGIWVPHRFHGCNIEEEVQIIIGIPGQRPFACRGVIRHKGLDANKQFFGIMLTAISKKQRAVLQGYVDGRLSQGTHSLLA